MGTEISEILRRFRKSVSRNKVSRRFLSYSDFDDFGQKSAGQSGPASSEALDNICGRAKRGTRILILVNSSFLMLDKVCGHQNVRNFA